MFNQDNYALVISLLCFGTRMSTINYYIPLQNKATVFQLANVLILTILLLILYYLLTQLVEAAARGHSEVNAFKFQERTSSEALRLMDFQSYLQSVRNEVRLVILASLLASDLGQICFEFKHKVFIRLMFACVSIGQYL